MGDTGMKKKVAALGMAAAMLTGIAESVPAEEVTLHPILTMEQAQTMLPAASEEAKRGGHAVCISIVDRSGQTLAVLRHHDAGVHTLEASYKKAYTAASQKRKTVDIARGVREGSIPEDIRYLDRRFSLMEGGMPIMLGGHVVGGIGVGGAHGSEDSRIAAAALASLKETEK